MEVLSPHEDLKTKEGQTRNCSGTARYFKHRVPTILFGIRRTSKLKGGILIKGRTNGVVVGEVVHLLVKDIAGKDFTLSAKVAGDGKFRAYASLSHLANGPIRIAATTTSLDGAHLSAESQWIIDLPPGVSDICADDQRYQRYCFVQIVNDPQEFSSLPILLDQETHLGDTSFGHYLPWPRMAPSEALDHERFGPSTQISVYSISSNGLITIPPRLKP